MTRADVASVGCVTQPDTKFIGLERGVCAIPWTPKDAKSKTKKAKSPKAQRQWAKVANAELAKTGDDGKAIKIANGVVAKRQRAKRLEGKKL